MNDLSVKQLNECIRALEEARARFKNREVSHCPPASGSVLMRSEKWGWSLARVERITLTHNHASNRYYGVKILGVKLLVWHWSFDRPAPNGKAEI